MLYRIKLGLKNTSFIKILSSIIISIVAIWGIYEPFVSLVLQNPQHGSLQYIVLAFLGGLYGIVRLAIPKSVSFKISGSNTIVTIKEGDLLEFPGHIIIAVNEYFDSLIGDHVSPNSLHGKLITIKYKGDSVRFNEEVAKALISVSYEEVPRNIGQTKKYPIGTTAVLNYGQYRIFLPVLTHTNIITLKAKADVTDLWMCLEKIWQAVNTSGNGHPVAIPLIGSGLSDVNLSYHELLQLILLSIAYKTKHGEISKNITILLTKEAYSSINLKAVVTEWGLD